MSGDLWDLVIGSLGADQGRALAEVLVCREDGRELPEDPELLRAAVAGAFTLGARSHVDGSPRSLPRVPVVFEALDHLSTVLERVDPASAELIDWWFTALHAQERTGAFRRGTHLAPELRAALHTLLEGGPVLRVMQQVFLLDAAVHELNVVASRGMALDHAPHALFRKGVRELRQAVERGDDPPPLLLDREADELLARYAPRSASAGERAEIEALLEALLAAAARVAAAAAHAPSDAHRPRRPRLPHVSPELVEPLAAALMPLLAAATDVDAAVARVLSGAEAAPRMALSNALVLREFGRDSPRIAAALRDLDEVRRQLEEVRGDRPAGEEERAMLARGAVGAARDLLDRLRAATVEAERVERCTTWLQSLNEALRGTTTSPPIVEAAERLLDMARASLAAGDLDEAAASASAAARAASLPEELATAPWERRSPAPEEPLLEPGTYPPGMDPAVLRLHDAVAAGVAAAVVAEARVAAQSIVQRYDSSRVSHAFVDALRVAEAHPRVGVPLLEALADLLPLVHRPKLYFHLVAALRRAGRVDEAEALRARTVPPIPADDLGAGAPLDGAENIEPDASLASAPTPKDEHDEADFERWKRAEANGDRLQAARELEQILEHRFRHWAAGIAIANYVRAGRPEDGLRLYRDRCGRTWVTAKMAWNIGCAFARIGLRAEALASFRVFAGASSAPVHPARWQPVRRLFEAAGEAAPEVALKPVAGSPAAGARETPVRAPARPGGGGDEARFGETARTQRARVLAEQGHADAAVKLLREVLATNPNSPAGEQLIKVETQRGRLQAAIDAIDRLEPERRKWQDRLRLAQAAVDLGDLKVAHEQLDRASDRGAPPDRFRTLAERIEQQGMGARAASRGVDATLTERARSGELHRDEWAGVARGLAGDGRLAEAVEIVSASGTASAWMAPLIVVEAHRIDAPVPEDPEVRRALTALVAQAGDIEAIQLLAERLPAGEALHLVEHAEDKVPRPARPLLWARRRNLLVGMGRRDDARDFVAEHWPPLPPRPVRLDAESAVRLEPRLTGQSPTKTSWQASVASGSIDDYNWDDPRQAADGWTRYVRAGRRSGLAQAVGALLRIDDPVAALDLVRDALGPDWDVDGDQQQAGQYLTPAATWNIATAYAAVGDLPRAARTFGLFFAVTAIDPPASAMEAVEQIFAAVDRPVPRVGARSAADATALPSALQTEIDELRRQPSAHEFPGFAKRLRDAMRHSVDPAVAVAVAEELFERCQAFGEHGHSAMALVLEDAASKEVEGAAERAWQQHVVPLGKQLGTGSSAIALRLATDLGRLEELRAMVERSTALNERQRLAMQARIAAHSGDDEEARRLAKALLGLDPTSRVAEQIRTGTYRVEGVGRESHVVATTRAPSERSVARLKELRALVLQRAEAGASPTLADLREHLEWLEQRSTAALALQPLGPDARSAVAEEHKRAERDLRRGRIPEAAETLESLVEEVPGDARLKHDHALAYLNLVESRGVALATTVPGVVGRLLNARWAFSHDRDPHAAEALLRDADLRAAAPEIREEVLVARSAVLVALESEGEAVRALVDGLGALPPARGARLALDALTLAVKAGDERQIARALEEVRARDLDTHGDATLDWAIQNREYRWVLDHARKSARGSGLGRHGVVHRLAGAAHEDPEEAAPIIDALLAWAGDRDDIDERLRRVVADAAAEAGRVERGLDTLLTEVDRWPADVESDVTSQFRKSIIRWATRYDARDVARAALVQRLEARGIRSSRLDKDVRSGAPRGGPINTDAIRAAIGENDFDEAIGAIEDIVEDLAERHETDRAALEEAGRAWLEIVRTAARTTEQAAWSGGELSALANALDAAERAAKSGVDQLTAAAAERVADLHTVVIKLGGRALKFARDLAEAGTRLEILGEVRRVDPAAEGGGGPVEVALRVGVDRAGDEETTVRVRVACGSEVQEELVTLSGAERSRDLVVLLPRATPVEDVEVSAEFPSLDGKKVGRTCKQRTVLPSAYERAIRDDFSPGRVHLKLFRGRAEEQGTIRRHFLNPGAAVMLLFGRRQIGKSSLAQSLRPKPDATDPPLGDTVVVFADCQNWPQTPYAEAQDLLGWIATLLTAEVDDWQSLTTALDGIDSTPQALATALRRSGQASDARERRILLILDEFQIVLDGLEDDVRSQVVDQLRSLVNRDDVPLSLMLCGSPTRRRWETLLGGSRLLQEIWWEELGSLSDNAVEEVLEVGFPSGEVKLLDEAVEQVQATVRGVPFSLHHLGKSIANSLAMHRRFTADKALVREARERIQANAELVSSLLRPDGRTLDKQLLIRLAWLTAALDRNEAADEIHRVDRVLDLLEDVLEDEGETDDDPHMVLDACVEAGFIESDANRGTVRWWNELIRDGVHAELERRGLDPAHAGLELDDEDLDTDDQPGGGAEEVSGGAYPEDLADVDPVPALAEPQAVNGLRATLEALPPARRSAEVTKAVSAVASAAGETDAQLVVTLLIESMSGVRPDPGTSAAARVDATRCALESLDEALVDDELFSILDTGLGHQDGSDYADVDELIARLRHWLGGNGDGA